MTLGKQAGEASHRWVLERNCTLGSVARNATTLPPVPAFSTYGSPQASPL